VHYSAALQSVRRFRWYDSTHVCKLIALYTANVYSAEREMSASACARSVAGYGRCLLFCAPHKWLTGVGMTEFFSPAASRPSPFNANPPRSDNRSRISVRAASIINVNHVILFSFRTLRPVWIRQPDRRTCDGYDGKTKSDWTSIVRGPCGGSGTEWS